ncbi:MAG: hypothetical protein WC606_00495 [Candidatus Absconditabacterales bacterium]
MLDNDLHRFLLQQGIPQESLPKLIVVSKHDLVPIMEGYDKENRTKNFYICVCNSGHDVCCNNSNWTFSGWNIRVNGCNVVFFKGEWVFDITKIPIFQNILFIVSKRTKENELARRRDMVFFSNDRKKLIKKSKRNETERRKTSKSNYR